MSDDLKKQFGRRLHVLRRSRDITQEHLAENIGRSVNFISLIENGQAAPSLKTIESIAKALRVEVAELFQFDSQ